METLSTIDKMASDLLLKMPAIIENGMAYGGDLAHRFIVFNIVQYSFYVIFGMIVIAFCVYLMKVIWKRRESLSDGYEDRDAKAGWMIALIMITVFQVGIVVSIIDNSTTIAKAYIIPELYIVEYFKK